MGSVDLRSKIEVDETAVRAGLFFDLVADAKR